MPVTPTYPGVYIEEIPSGVRTITGVSTSVAAFLGYLTRGPMNQPVRVFNFGDFERVYGGLDRESDVSYAVEQFFRNGGTEAWIVRTASGDVSAASVVIGDGSGSAGLELEAIHPGQWGDNLRVTVSYPSPDPGDVFALTVQLFAEQAGDLVPVVNESFPNLTTAADSPRNVQEVINDGFSGSKLVRVRAVADDRPQITGTLSGDLSGSGGLTSSSPTLKVTVAGNEHTASLPLPTPATVIEARGALEAAIRAADPADPVFADATVSLITEANGSSPGQRLRILAGPEAAPGAIITFGADGTDPTASELGLTGTEVQPNVQTYQLGAGEVSNSSQNGGESGRNGAQPDANALVGDRNAKTGLYALEDVDLFNLLVIPRVGLVSGPRALDPDRSLAMNQAATILTAASRYCRQRRAFLLVDPPNDIDELQEAREWIEANAGLRHDHAAVYFPRIGVPDPLNEFKMRWLGPSGTMAGLYARTDSERGVWKAPAGTEAALRGARKLEVKLADTGSGVLNPLGVNALRTFPIYGSVCWGARTMVGSDERASQWKYVPVRRTALFIEESLYRGTQWVVFEPNDESLWAQIRLNVGSFMQRLFQQGAFQGTTPREAFFVKCDSETTTQDDIDRGIVNIVVGFAPLKPAEFVIIQIQQIANQGG